MTGIHCIDQALGLLACVVFKDKLEVDTSFKLPSVRPMTFGHDDIKLILTRFQLAHLDIGEHIVLTIRYDSGSPSQIIIVINLAIKQLSLLNS